MTLPPVGVWSPVSSHSLVYQHLRLDSTPVLPLSEETSLPTPSSLSRVRVSDHTKFQHSSVLFSSVPTPTPFITHPILTAGTSGTLTCGYTLSPPLDVIASATWTVNGSSVTGDERISTDRLSLTLSPLTTSDSGTYTCTLTIISLTPHVTVLGPQQSPPKEVYVYSKTYYCSHVLTCCESKLTIRCPSSRGLQEHSSVRELSLILLESAQHCREPHHWLQPDLCSSPDWYPSPPVSPAAPNCHLSHCGWTQIWSHLQLLNLHHH